jgi:hypothetical protein
MTMKALFKACLELMVRFSFDDHSDSEDDSDCADSTHLFIFAFDLMMFLSQLPMTCPTSS